VKEGGLAAVADTVVAGWLTADFRERKVQVTASMKDMLLASLVEGYIACCQALSTLDQRALLPKIKSPTLVIAGRHDMSTPIAAGEYIPRREPYHSRCRPYFQCRAAPCFHGGRGRLSDATLALSSFPFAATRSAQRAAG
jgi:pimeloyl-ACP methyl ester carboxylesterase